jgi:hypothetical protein
LLLLCSGCFSNTETLEGRWQTESTTTNAQSRLREVITYTFEENIVTRTLELQITSFDGLLSANLLAIDRATYTTDTSTTPSRITLTGLAELTSPTNAAFLSAAAISGQTERGLTLAFSDRSYFSLNEKGIFELEDGLLRLKFGGATDYPSDFLDAIEVDRFMKLLPFRVM